MEQPKVLYNKQVLVLVYSESESIVGSSVLITPSTQFFSSVGSLNQIFFENQAAGFVKSTLYDVNFDLVPDSYEINITIFTDPSQIRNIQVLSFYEYKIRKRVRMDMTCLAYANINTPYGASSVYLDGYLNFEQVEPLQTSTIISADYNSTILSLDSAFEDFVPDLLENYYGRNLTTSYDYSSVVVPNGLDSQTKISMRVKIPPNQKYFYVPSFLEVMKFSWIQYLSFFVPFAIFLQMFAEYIFRNRILDSHISYEVKLTK